MEPRMLQHNAHWVMIGLIVALFSGCKWMPGRPKESDRWRPPQDEKNFIVLYETNCLACHSNGKTVSASISMSDPLYLAILPRETLRKVIAQGVPGTPMPGFAEANGVGLTDAQIDILVQGIFKWAEGKSVTTGNLPPYSAPIGDAGRGATAFNTYCAKCHGAEGKGGKAGSVVDPDYLHLVSDQYLRTVIIAGRPELGMTNYQQNELGKPMSPQEISDVVGWLVSHRQNAAPAQLATTTDPPPPPRPSKSNQQ
jgi:cytochrome c oxidase cbb3-type subunit III